MNYLKLIQTGLLAAVVTSSLSACVTLNDVNGSVTGNIVITEQGKPTGEIGANIKFDLIEKSAKPNDSSDSSVKDIDGSLNGNITVNEKGEVNGSLGGEIKFNLKQQSETQNGRAVTSAKRAANNQSSSITKLAKTKFKVKEKIDGPIWFKEAMKWIGTTETKGAGNSNPTIETMHNYTKNAFGRSDATAWCASFSNWILKTTAEKYNLPDQYKGTGSAGARHFFAPDKYNAQKRDKRYLGWGENVAVDKLAVGDLATIIWNSNTNKGHVGFVVGVYLSAKGSVDGVWILGGNQRNQQDTSEAVTVSLYKLHKAELFEFKRVKGFKPNTEHYVKAYSEKNMQMIYGKNVGLRGSLKHSR